MFSFFGAYEQPEKVYEYLNQMVAVADRYGVMLCHENEKDIYGDTLERVQLIAQNVPGLKLVYDPANYLQCDQPADKTLPALHAKTDYFHVKDVVAETGEIVPAGYGDGHIDDVDGDNDTQQVPGGNPDTNPSDGNPSNPNGKDVILVHYDSDNDDDVDGDDEWTQVQKDPDTGKIIPAREIEDAYIKFSATVSEWADTYTVNYDILN